MTVPPNSITFFKQYKATLPLPETMTFLPLRSVFLYVLSASKALYKYKKYKNIYRFRLTKLKIRLLLCIQMRNTAS